MNKLFCLLLAAAMLPAASASAQATFHLGLRAGATYAASTAENSVEYYGGSYSVRKTPILAGQAGVVLEARFGSLALEPALVFSQKGENTSAVSTRSGVAGISYFEKNSTGRYNWLELPLNAIYFLPRLGRVDGLHVFGGPYAAVMVGGGEKGTYSSWTAARSSSTRNPGTNTQEFDNRAYTHQQRELRWDAGLNAGLGYRRGPLALRLGYGLGLLGQHSLDGEFRRAAYTRTAQLTATYFLTPPR